MRWPRIRALWVMGAVDESVRPALTSATDTSSPPGDRFNTFGTMLVLATARRAWLGQPVRLSTALRR